MSIQSKYLPVLGELAMSVYSVVKWIGINAKCFDSYSLPVKASVDS